MKIKILGITHELILIPRTKDLEEMEPDYRGRVTHNEREIRVITRPFAASNIQTFFHELAHAYCFIASGWIKSITEEQCDLFGAIMANFMEQNPESPDLMRSVIAGVDGLGNNKPLLPDRLEFQKECEEFRSSPDNGFDPSSKGPQVLPLFEKRKKTGGRKARFTVDQVKEALTKTEGNRTKAAVLLGAKVNVVRDMILKHPELAEFKRQKGISKFKKKKQEEKTKKRNFSGY